MLERDGHLTLAALYLGAHHETFGDSAVWGAGGPY